MVSKEQRREANERARLIMDGIRHDSEFRTPLDDLAWIALECLDFALIDEVDPMPIDEHALLSNAIHDIYLS